MNNSARLPSAAALSLIGAAPAQAADKLRRVAMFACDVVLVSTLAVTTLMHLCIGSAG